MTAKISLDHFLRADSGRLHDWTTRSQAELVRLCLAATLIGAGVYGAVVGCWWAPLQAFYVAIKLPLLILLTTLGNGLLNGMLAPLLGLNIPLRQTFVLVVLSFAVTSLVLAGLSPIAWFFVWNTPPLGTKTSLSSPEYGLLQLT